MIILRQWDFNEQTEKLVRSLLCNSENCSRKFHAWVHVVSRRTRRVNGKHPWL